MNNSELFVAIETAFRMMKEAGTYHSEYKALCAHLGALLKIQLDRCVKGEMK